MWRLRARTAREVIDKREAQDFLDPPKPPKTPKNPRDLCRFWALFQKRHKSLGFLGGLGTPVSTPTFFGGFLGVFGRLASAFWPFLVVLVKRPKKWGQFALLCILGSKLFGHLCGKNSHFLAKKCRPILAFGQNACRRHFLGGLWPKSWGFGVFTPVSGFFLFWVFSPFFWGAKSAPSLGC